MPSSPINLIGVTANCGNSTLGENACDEIVKKLREPNSADLVVINCQEVNLEATLAQLRGRAPGLVVAASELRTTFTKLHDVNVLKRKTGIATIVVYDPSKINSVSFDASSRIEVKGKGFKSGRNKGGVIQTLTVSRVGAEAAEPPLKIRTISGHLDSKEEGKRIYEWQQLKRATLPMASTWEELERSVPDLQVAGYDANTRSLYEKKAESDPKIVNMWESSNLDPRIAPFFLAPLGPELYSADNTYRTELSEVREDSSRPGLAKAGALDFVAIQNNTNLTSPAARLPNGTKRYHDSPRNIPGESGTYRDHDIVMSDMVQVSRVSDFERVRNHIALELVHAAPTLSQEVFALDDTPDNKMVLLSVYQRYLGPNGSLQAEIKYAAPVDEKKNVKPWFEDLKITHNLPAEKEGLIEMLNRMKQVTFNPQRTFGSNKTAYVEPMTRLIESHNEYMIDPTEAKYDLVKHSLQTLRSTTKDPEKLSVVDAYEQKLEVCKILSSRSQVTTPQSSVDSSERSPGMSESLSSLSSSSSKDSSAINESRESQLKMRETISEWRNQQEKTESTNDEESPKPNGP